MINTIKFMTVKTLLTGLVIAALFSSCDPNADKQVGNANRLQNTTTSNGGGSVGNTGSGTNATDAPLDGGLSILLLAGSAYGVRRVRRAKQEKER